MTLCAATLSSTITATRAGDGAISAVSSAPSVASVSVSGNNYCDRKGRRIGHNHCQRG